MYSSKEKLVISIFEHLTITIFDMTTVRSSRKNFLHLGKYLLRECMLLLWLLQSNLVLVNSFEYTKCQYWCNFLITDVPFNNQLSDYTGKFSIINWVDNINWPLKSLKAEVLSVSPNCQSLRLRANARKSQFLSSLRRPIYIINSVDNTKLSCYTLPPTQHHSFFRNLPPLLLCHINNNNNNNNERSLIRI